MKFMKARMNKWREVIMCIILGCVIGLLVMQVIENIRVSLEDDADEQDEM